MGVSDIVRQGRLRWFGHVERKDAGDWVSACRDMVVTGKRDRDRGKKTWKECVADDMKKLKLKREDAHDRAAWRGSIVQPVLARKHGREEAMTSSRLLYKLMMMMMMMTQH